MTVEMSEWAKDNAAGRAEADAIIDRMERDGCPLELVRRLDLEANASGIEIGLFNRIAERLILDA